MRERIGERISGGAGSGGEREKKRKRKKEKKKESGGDKLYQAMTPIFNPKTPEL